MLFTEIRRSVLVAVTTIAAVLSLAAQAPQQGVVPAGTDNPYRRAGQIPARIVDFRIEPTAIQAGQPATILWATENQDGITIEPEIGNLFQARGSREIHP